MPYPWLKLWDDCLDTDVQDLPPTLFKFWVNCLMLANRGRIRGILPDTKRIARILGLAPGEVDRMISELIELGHLDRMDDDSISPHNWDRWQAEGSSTSRVKKHRESKGALLKRDETGETLETSCNTMKRVKRDATNETPETNETAETSPLISSSYSSSGSSSLGEEIQEKGGDQPRPPDDLAHVEQAITLLAGDLRTEPHSMELSRNHELPGYRHVKGFQWLHAARVITGPISGSVHEQDAKRSRFGYLRGIAQNVTKEEFMSPPARASPPTRGPDKARAFTAELNAKVKQSEDTDDEDLPF